LSLRFSCRPASLARMRERVAAANTAGWPGRIRACRLRRSKDRVAAFRGHCCGVSSTCSPSTVLHSPASRPPAPRCAAAALSQVQGQVGQAGLCGRLRSNSSSKLRHASRRRRGLVCYSVCKWRPRILSGQPAMFAAATLSRIRAKAFGRHEHRNDKNSFTLKSESQFSNGCVCH
jgi:hypothetical protein